jgi:peptidyl-prolyl cis-trans isomerase C
MLEESEIAAELQYAPAASLDEARAAAERALTIRRLLEGRARELGLLAADERDEATRVAAIEAVLEAEIDVPVADEAACRAWHAANPEAIRSPDLVEASHILFAAAPDDRDGRQRALAEAKAALAEIEAAPAKFEAIARARSACPSGANGGALGQIARGDTVPEFETYLFALDEGELCAEPIPSRYGYHLAKLAHRARGRALPFEAARGAIARRIEDRAYREALRAHLAGLAARAGVVLA